MTAHLHGQDQRLFGGNADVLLARYVWNVGQCARADVVLLCLALSLFKRSKVSALDNTNYLTANNHICFTESWQILRGVKGATL